MLVPPLYVICVGFYGMAKNIDPLYLILSHFNLPRKLYRKVTEQMNRHSEEFSIEGFIFGFAAGVMLLLFVVPQWEWSEKDAVGIDAYRGFANIAFVLCVAILCSVVGWVIGMLIQAWTVMFVQLGSETPPEPEKDAPQDGTEYIRRDGQWMRPYREESEAANG